MAVYQYQLCWLTHCNRGQAPSHIGMRRTMSIYSAMKKPAATAGFFVQAGG